MSSVRSLTAHDRPALWFIGATAVVALGARAVAAIGPSTVVPIGCPFLTSTGWQCPFCGCTRALAALGRGDVAAAFAFNQVFVVALGLVAGFGVVAAAGKADVVLRRLPAARMLWTAGLVVLAIFWVGRNLV